MVVFKIVLHFIIPFVAEAPKFGQLVVDVVPSEQVLELTPAVDVTSHAVVGMVGSEEGERASDALLDCRAVSFNVHALLDRGGAGGHQAAVLFY